MKNSFIIIILLFLSACQQKIEYTSSKSISFSDFKESLLLKGEDLLFDEPVMKPSKIYVIDSLIFLINTNTEYLFQCFNINTGKQTKEFISFGSGPDEMLNPISLGQKDSFIYVFDGMKRNILFFNKTSFLQSEQPQSFRQIDLDDMFSNAFLSSNNHVIATCIQPDSKRLTFFNEKGERMDKGEFPSFNHSQTKFEKTQGFDCEMEYNSELQKICLIYKYTDLIEFYSIKGELLNRIHGPEHFFPSFTQRNTENSIQLRAVKGKSQDGYFCPISYNDELYVLYSGKFFDPKTRPYLIDQILVFDWSGTPIKRLLLDKPIYCFTIDKKNNILYGLSFSPDFHIVKYALI